MGRLRTERPQQSTFFNLACQHFFAGWKYRSHPDSAFSELELAARCRKAEISCSMAMMRCSKPSNRSTTFESRRLNLFSEMLPEGASICNCGVATGGAKKTCIGRGRGRGPAGNMEVWLMGTVRPVVPRIAACSTWPAWPCDEGRVAIGHLTGSLSHDA